MAKKRKTYEVLFEKDSEPGWWVVTVPSVQGCRTQSRTIAQGLERIREALDLFVSDAESAELIQRVKLDAKTTKVVDDYREARRKAEEYVEKAQELLAEAASSLTKKAKLSRRDAGTVLGVSYQRVQQVGEGSARE